MSLPAFRRIAALAVAHRADLDTAARLTAAQAWVGGGAPHFAAAVATHRASTQSAFAVALASVAQSLVRQGEPAPAIPELATPSPATPATHGPFRGIDVRAMTDLITTLDTAADRLAQAGTRVSAELTALSLPASPGWTISRAAEWSATQVPDLRRRLSRIRREHTWSIPADVAAFDLFGVYAAAADPDALLARLATGDAGSLGQLLAMRDPALPARVNAWWRRLPPSAQAPLLRLAGFGLLNGLPAAVRDRTNRNLLAAEKERLTKELSGQPDPSAVLGDLRALAAPSALVAQDRTMAALRDIAMVEKALAVGGTAGHPPAYLLAFDLHGTGRLIVSWGDPDTADITATYVPGLNSELGGFAGDIDRARVLWQQCQATAGGKQIASIAWLGYDAPQLEHVLKPGQTVAGDAAAERGGASLAAFTDGLRASRAAESRHVVIGHSYGSLVTGKAAVLRPGRLADELIFVGSPGVGVRRAADLRVDPAHVWVGEDPNDLVTTLGRFTEDPGSRAFGAQSFPVGRHLMHEAHSSYWDMHSPSLRNLGRITTGNYQEIESVNRPIQPQLLLPDFQTPGR